MSAKGRNRPGKALMNSISRTYSLRRFESSHDPDYSAALTVYVTNIAPDARTNSNEITHWIEKTYREYGDEFVVCGFFVDDKVIGLAEFAFFRRQRVLFFDYLVLHRAHRSQGEYFQFARMVQDWIDREGYEFDFAVAEVSFETNASFPTDRSVLLVRLFKQMGFGVAQCEYSQPPLGLDNPQSDIRAHLLIASRESVTSVKRETLLHIVETALFQHYERWYSAFLKDKSAYRALLDKRLREFKQRLENQEEILIDGVKLLHPPLLPSPAPKAAPLSPLSRPLVVFATFALVCGSLILLQSRVLLPMQTTMFLFIGTLIALATAFSLLDKTHRGTLDRLLKVFTNLFGKRK